MTSALLTTFLIVCDLGIPSYESANGDVTSALFEKPLGTFSNSSGTKLVRIGSVKSIRNRRSNERQATGGTVRRYTRHCVHVYAATSGLRAFVVQTGGREKKKR